MSKIFLPALLLALFCMSAYGADNNGGGPIFWDDAWHGTWGGLIGMAAGGLIGLGFDLWWNSEHRPDSLQQAVLSVAVPVIAINAGYLFGFPLGIWGFRNNDSAAGSAWGAVCGSVLGEAAAAGCYFAISLLPESPNYLNICAIVLGLTFPAIGSVIGYNLTKNNTATGYLFNTEDGKLALSMPALSIGLGNKTGNLTCYAPLVRMVF